MADNTMQFQGNFTSTGVVANLNIRSDFDQLEVWNMTVAAGAQTTAVGAYYLWMNGFDGDSAWVRYKSNAANAANLDGRITSGGITRINTSAQSLSAATAALTDISNAAPPVITCANHGFITGDVVRIYNATGAAQLGGMDFEVAYVGANSFSLRYMRGIAAAAAPGAGSYARRVKYDNLYYPQYRYVTRIASAGNQALVTLSVTHDLTVGQSITFKVPAITSVYFGMNELDNLSGTITAVGTADADGYTNTITVDVDVSGFTAFAFPLTANAPFSPALVIPQGEDTAQALSSSVDILQDATLNQSFLGAQLGLGPAGDGSDGPAGASGDVMYWIARKAFSVDDNSVTNP